MRPVSDSSIAQWVADRIHPFAQDVGSVVPDGFEAYARAFHPAGRDEGQDSTNVRWAHIAEVNGKIAHPEMRFESIVPEDCFAEAYNWRKGQPGLWDWPPSDGEITDDLARDLSELLGNHTTTPDDCVFAYWDGWGDPMPLMPTPTGENERVEQQNVLERYKSGEIFDGTPRASRDHASILSIPGRDFYLFEGDIAEAVTEWDGMGGSLPSMWWPRDLAWCVATEIDFDSTYIGASAACIDAVVADPRVEAMKTDAKHSIGPDRINPT